MRATPNARFQPEKVAYYRKEVQPKLYGFAVVTAITLALLVFFIAWCGASSPCRRLDTTFAGQAGVAGLADRPLVHKTGSACSAPVLALSCRGSHGQ